MGKLSNINRRVFAKFLIENGYVKARTNGGHEIWEKEGMPRPVVIQTHENSIPEMVIRHNIRTMRISPKALEQFLDRK